MSNGPYEARETDPVFDLPSEVDLRDYLLGELVSGEIDSRIEALKQDGHDNDAFQERLDAVEDELMDAYVQDALSAGDRKLFEEHYLRDEEGSLVPSRMEKWDIARKAKAHGDASSNDLPSGGKSDGAASSEARQ